MRGRHSRAAGLPPVVVEELLGFGEAGFAGGGGAELDLVPVVAERRRVARGQWLVASGEENCRLRIGSSGSS